MKTTLLVQGLIFRDTLFLSNQKGGNGSPGVLLKNLNGGVPTGSPNPNAVSDQKSNFPPPLSDLATKLQTRCQA